MQVKLMPLNRPLWLTVFLHPGYQRNQAEFGESPWIGEAVLALPKVYAEEGAKTGREKGLETFVIACRYGRG